MKLKKYKGHNYLSLVATIVPVLLIFFWASPSKGGDTPTTPDAPAATNPISLQIGTTYDALYMFRGVKEIQGGLASSDATITSYGFSASAWYAIGTKQAYEELDVNVGYSRTFGPVTLSIGGIYYHYPRSGTPISDTYEITGGAAYTFLKYYTLSLNYFEDVKSINGGYAETRLAADYPVLDKKPYTINIQPYILGSYSFKYNSNTDAWNNTQFGTTVMFSIGDHFSVAPYVSYSIPLGAIDNTEKKEFWGGVRLQYSF